MNISWIIGIAGGLMVVLGFAVMIWAIPSFYRTNKNTSEEIFGASSKDNFYINPDLKEYPPIKSMSKAHTSKNKRRISNQLNVRSSGYGSRSMDNSGLDTLHTVLLVNALNSNGNSDQSIENHRSNNTDDDYTTKHNNNNFPSESSYVSDSYSHSCESSCDSSYDSSSSSDSSSSCGGCD